MRKPIVRDAKSQELVDLFAKRLRDTMDGLGIKAADLSRRSGVSKGQISLYLRAVNEPGQTNVYKMAVSMGISPAWLMALNGEPVARIQLDKEMIELCGDLNTETRGQAKAIIRSLVELDRTKKGTSDDRKVAT